MLFSKGRLRTGTLIEACITHIARARVDHHAIVPIVPNRVEQVDKLLERSHSVKGWLCSLWASPDV